MNSNKHLTVFFDGSCPLCVREIALYRRLTPLTKVIWLDVSEADPMQSGIGLSQCDAMRRFHVMDNGGEIYSGAAAFTTLWKNYSGWRLLGKVFSLPLLSQLAEWSYRLFLVFRPALQKTVKYFLK